MKKTGDLLKELKRDNCDIEEYLEKNEEIFICYDIKEFYENAIERSGLSKSNIINKSDFSYCYFYDVINGRKIPGRDKIIRLALTMKISVDECDKILTISGKSSLYPRVKRDSVIIYALQNGYSVFKTNKLLIQCEEVQLK